MQAGDVHDEGGGDEDLGQGGIQPVELRIGPVTDEACGDVEICSGRPARIGKWPQGRHNAFQVPDDRFRWRNSRKQPQRLLCGFCSATREVVRWKEGEAGPLLPECNGAGFEVEFEPGGLLNKMRAVRKSRPEALVIDLMRAPRNGCKLASSIRMTTYTHHMSIVFVDGVAEKVDCIRSGCRGSVAGWRSRLWIHREGMPVSLWFCRDPGVFEESIWKDAITVTDGRLACGGPELRRRVFL